ncbi:hypothetical protein [Lysobacter humi (ex Lee et al. 2017)]
MNIAARVQLHHVDDVRQLSPKLLANALAETYKGRRLRLEDLPAADNPEYECRPPALPSRTFHCTWWLMESGARERGFSASFWVNETGVFQKVRVVPVVRSKRRTSVAPNNPSKPTPLRGAA